MGRIDRTDVPHIGRPLANTLIYVLDPYGQPVPVGVAGEIFIGGVAVARGYLNKPEQTCERFVANPMSPIPAATMYKTGDLARWLPNGDLEYLGRNDHQVKIRGHRVELGEIESRLGSVPGVRSAVVVARESDVGDKRLIAYLTTEEGIGLAASRLRAELSALLPEHMIPAAFVLMDEFPLTPAGKLDRKALPVPDQSSVATREFEPPQGEVEQTLARIWEDLLGVERVGRQDDFFDLGGHSLLAVRLLARMQTDLNVRIDISALFKNPQLAAFAKQVLITLVAQEFELQDLEELAVEGDSGS
jgi:long-subunit acyl-CoA synthetase (AMP-forming)